MRTAGRDTDRALDPRAQCARYGKSWMTLHRWRKSVLYPQPDFYVGKTPYVWLSTLVKWERRLPDRSPMVGGVLGRELHPASDPARKCDPPAATHGKKCNLPLPHARIQADFFGMLVGMAPADTASAGAVAAIVGGAFAFLWAGWVLRKGRKLELPAA